MIEGLIDKIIVANVAYALMDMFVLELIISLVFRTNENGLHVNLVVNNTRNTRLYVLAFVFIGVLFFAVSNAFQNPIIKLLATLGWQLYILTIGLFGIVTFWVAKVILGKNWRNPMVVAGLIISVLTFLILVVDYIV